jgi:hypothetical protein
MAERPAKRTKLLSDSESDGSDNEGVKLPKPKKSSMKAEFKINDEFAKRYEHNNKRADLHRLEERYGKGSARGRVGRILHRRVRGRRCRAGHRGSGRGNLRNSERNQEQGPEGIR